MTERSVTAGLSEELRPEGLRRQERLLEQLGLEDKVALLTGETAFTLPGNDTIGLAPLAFSDGPTGVRGLKFIGGDPVALFPNATLISGSWDDDIAEEVGRMLSEEAHRQKIHVVLGPTINLHRTPLGGRLFEAYSEDPYLTGRSAAAYVRGMQANGTAACLKHLVANESETLRNFVDSRLSETALREVYLLPFEMAVDDAGAWSMMAAYNDINGVTATEQDHVQNDIVKSEWAWDGLIMSDWFATKRTVESANGGLDLVMPGPEGPWGERLFAAVRRGDVSEATVDEHLARLLLLAERTGGLRPASGEETNGFKTGMPAPDSPERKEQLRRIASRGMVLLKNEGDVLPLSEEGPLALLGRHAIATQAMGGGSAQVNPPYVSTIAEALTDRVGERLTVLDGVGVRKRPVPALTGFVTDPVTGEQGMRVTYLNAEGAEIASRHEDGAAITVGWDDDFSEMPTAVIFAARLGNHAGAVWLGGIGVGTWTISTDAGVLGQRNLPITGFDPAEAMLRPPSYTEAFELPAGAVVSVRLDFAPVDWAAKLAGNPALNLSEESHLLTTGSFGSVALVAQQDARTDEEAIAAAEEAACAAGTAVVVVGLTEEDETEMSDKQTLALPGRQDELVLRVAATATRTVVVVNAATPVLMPWLDDVDAVLIAGLPGQEGGNAVADVLTGAEEPTGRLVTSYPTADGASPAWNVTPGPDFGLEYTDGTAIGYRGYHAGNAPAPLFWFGHGLGYGSWEYGSARLLPPEAGGGAVVEVDITNTGTRASRETVQLYFLPAEEGQPVRLAGYAGSRVETGETAAVRVGCDGRLFRRWDEAENAWKPLNDGELIIARGLGDVRARLPLG
ncbi:glycoside hydrolase family 3 protein [Arthrobacter cavernae]|uniref:Glycoside hydrolase family 3 C-terminal domain-containing protein n=1 Tax=Arthrobacter cavernae TaxID=2817681 RepID=A0A939HFL3_9MICC|nr:glycoside hydrolase family 3 C-terminal domain-containing protein [Arthrobacter cavernae]MBO1269001.1 glycoside hydrolase family 3 C-terminal domain-containing protein [Arthrobacter cavernae]